MHRITGRRSPSLLRIPGRRALVGAAVACVAALALGGTAVADVIFDDQAPFSGTTHAYYAIQAKHSQMNLNVPEASTQPATQIIQWKQPGALNEQWEYVGARDGWYLAPHHSIRNRWSRQCLAVDSKADGAPVVQRPCDGTASQKWDFFKSGPGGYGYWTNYWSGLDLNVVGASTQLGAKLVQYHHVAGASNTLFASVSDNPNHVE